MKSLFITLAFSMIIFNALAQDKNQKKVEEGRRAGMDSKHLYNKCNIYKYIVFGTNI